MIRRIIVYLSVCLVISACATTPMTLRDKSNSTIEKAINGDANAQNDLGCMYYKGQGVKLDYQEAVNWYRKAAEQGGVEAQEQVKKLEMKIELSEQNYD